MNRCWHQHDSLLSSRWFVLITKMTRPYDKNVSFLSPTRPVLITSTALWRSFHQHGTLLSPAWHVLVMRHDQFSLQSSLVFIISLILLIVLILLIRTRRILIPSNQSMTHSNSHYDESSSAQCTQHRSAELTRCHCAAILVLITGTTRSRHQQDAFLLSI